MFLHVCFLFRGIAMQIGFFCLQTRLKLLRSDTGIGKPRSMGLSSALSPIFEWPWKLRIVFIFLNVWKTTFFLVFYLFYIYLWLHRIFVAACGLQLWRVVVAFHCGVQAFHCGGFSCCGTWALSRLVGLIAPWHVESSQPGIKPMFPTLAGGFLTTGLPGKSQNILYHVKNTWYSNIGVYKVLLESRHAHHLMYHLRLCYNGRLAQWERMWPAKLKILTIWPFSGKLANSWSIKQK